MGKKVRPGPGQLHLPLVGMRPVCPLCGKPACILGQYDPVFEYAICRECSIAGPCPIEIFEFDPKSKDKTKLRIKRDADMDARERRVVLTGRLKDAVKGSPRVLDYRKMLRTARRGNAAIQIRLPFCDRCGKPHDRRSYFDSYKPLCQECEDIRAVEALWRNRGIFKNDEDVEITLDRLHGAFPDLFERGVLPDMWFRLVGEAN